jgi:alanine dehydrogenase
MSAKTGWTAGLPRMHKEAGERRDFLPEFVRTLDAAGAAEIVLEDGYGAVVGLPTDAYLAASPVARSATMQETFAQDIVIVIRYRDEQAIRLSRPGSILVTMLHLVTRPERASLLEEFDVQRCRPT